MNFHLIKTAASIAVLLGAFASPTLVTAAGHSEALAEGKRLAFDRKLGNCLACHVITGKSQEGNIGPPLLAMSARYPDKAKLRAQIFDATVRNPGSSMPPFGKHNALSGKQIDLITDYIHSL